ncbi:MAG: Ig-like domain-containing protein [Bacteroidota bacterium]|nr:Ig-like domain-containing protein [Bacteroidota bacterium]
MRTLISAILLLLLASCAQVVPLTGGNEDEKAPQPTELIPADKTLNFNSERITITFDEYIQLKDIFNQLIITPQLKEQPEINANGKTLTIKFNETLRENTTYKLMFGNAICDITEGNILADYEYSFSTGSFIDTLQLKGVIRDAYSGKPVKDSWVMMYFENNDSVVYKSKPDYLTKTNANGIYTLKGLKPGSYKIVTLIDNNKNYLYDNGELFGFREAPVSVPQDSVVEMKMFKENPPKVYISKTEHLLPEKVNVVFNTGIEKLSSVSVTNTNGVQVTDCSYKMNRTKDTLRFYFNTMINDSVYIKVGFNDNKVDSSLVTFLSADQLQVQFSKKRLPFEINSVHRSESTLPYNLMEYKLYSTFLISGTDKNKLVLKENGTVLAPEALSITRSNGDSVSIQHKWKSNAEYEISLMKNFAKDNFERGSDSLVFKFKTNEKSDYGSLKLLLSDLESNNYVVQMINSLNKVVYEKYIDVSLLKSGSGGKNSFELQFKDIIPETYTLRLISDINNDKAFSPGVYLKKVQAEKTYTYPQAIKIISDWDVEQIWNIGQ